MRRTNRSRKEFYEEKEETSAIPGRDRDWGDSDAKYGRVINSAYVNVREDPEKYSKILLKLQRYCPVKILKDVGQYYLVSVSTHIDTSVTGYILKDYCEVIFGGE